MEAWQPSTVNTALQSPYFFVLTEKHRCFIRDEEAESCTNIFRSKISTHSWSVQRMQTCSAGTLDPIFFIYIPSENHLIPPKMTALTVEKDQLKNVHF
jgi:hypothetical protein